MPGEAGPPLTASHDTSTPLAGVDSVSDPVSPSVPAPVRIAETVSPDAPETPPSSPSTHQPAPQSTSRSSSEATGHPTPARRRRLFVLLVVVAVLAYATDQLSKVIALDTLADGEPRPFIGDFIQLRLIGNPGAALSLGAGNTWVMTLIAVGVLCAIVFVARDLGSRAWALALGLLLGAALGNLTDRFARPPGGGQGHVVDFLDYNRWFIGNVADIWIVGAAGLIVLLAVLGIGVDGRRDRDRLREADAAAAADGVGAQSSTESSTEPSTDSSTTGPASGPTPGTGPHGESGAEPGQTRSESTGGGTRA